MGILLIISWASLESYGILLIISWISLESYRDSYDLHGFLSSLMGILRIFSWASLKAFGSSSDIFMGFSQVSWASLSFHLYLFKFFFFRVFSCPFCFRRDPTKISCPLLSNIKNTDFQKLGSSSYQVALVLLIASIIQYDYPSLNLKNSLNLRPEN